MFAGPTGRQRGQLPVETTGFIGREAELARLSALLEQARLITVTGPGGVGKSRMALRAAAAAASGFADGVCLVELSALREPGLLAHTVAGALGLPEQSQDSQLDAVLTDLSDRHLLLVLDTCEHLIDACAMLAEAVVAQAPRVTVLATSREPLDVSGETACPVGPLPVPRQPEEDAIGGSAVELFLQRAAAAVPGFTATADDLADVIRLCQRLDGIPLAIELAAVRLRALPLDELAGRLDQRLALLTSGQRGGRHRTLRDAIGWSYDLCTPAEQAMWARLSVFAGSFTMSAAEEVCADGPDAGRVMPTVIRLVDKSVIVRIEAAEAGGTPTQYRLLDTIREFGAERLGRSGDAGGPRRRFVARYLAMARYFRDHFLDDDQLTRMRELRREHANVRAALEYAFGDEENDAAQADGVELAIALSAYWRARGLAREGSYWLDRAAERARAGSAERGHAVLEGGHLLAVQGDAAGALAAASQVITLAAPLGDKALAAGGYLVKTAALCGKGRLTAAAESGEEARRRLTALGDQFGLASLDAQLAYLALLNDDIEAALGHVERGLRQLSGSRERWLHANLYMLASLSLYLAGRDIESTWTATRALQVKQEIGDVIGIAFTLELLGWLAARAGSHQRAAWLLGGADPLWERAGGRLAATASFERLHAEAVGRCGSALGGKLFAELFARGVRHPVEAMTAFAVNDAGDPAEGGGGTRIRLPSQLTAREREIASLVAAGLSNRQIADMLFISRRTVDAHLEHIFGKLGITSRVMLTIQLREHSAVTDTGANA
ncbi:MAG TPA: LuxR C-terminal-related transcriptional regulator [Trebonia sp.]|nr:LuxR C-terminal-related transcriptional regulator [Trebonia sp.]